MRFRDQTLFAVGSLSGALSQWLLVWLFARFGGGATAVGEYSLLLAIATPAFILGQFGLRTVHLSLRTDYPWRSYVTLRTFGVLISLIAVLIYGIYFSAANPWLWFAVISVKVLDSYSDLLYARLQRGNYLRELGYINILKSLGMALVAAFVILISGSVASALLASASISVGIILYIYKRLPSSSTRTTQNNSGYKRILRAGFPTTVSEGLASLSTYLPLLLLSFSGGAQTAGIYASAAYLLTLANLAGSIMKNVLITPYRWAYEDAGADAVLQKSRKAAGLLTVLGFVCAPVVVLCGSPVLQFVYGQEFSLGYIELTLLAIAAIPIAPSYIYSTSLNVFNAFSGQAWVWLGACVLGLGMGLAATSLGTLTELTAALLVALTTTWSRLVGAMLITWWVRHRLGT